MMTSRVDRLRHPASPLPALAALAALALAIALAPAATGLAPAHADGGAAAELTSLVNAERAAAGLPALQGSSDLVEVATRHSSRMASSGNLHHNPNLGSEVSNWTRVAENVGQGPSPRAIHDALMASSTHRANILDGGVSQVGVGIAVAGDTLWVTEIFRRPASASAPPPPPDEPAPPPPAREDSSTSPPAAPSAASSPSATDTAPDPSTADIIVAPADDGAVRLASPVVVDTADAGAVRAAPSPDAARVLTTARWFTIAWLLVE